ncbi:MAG: hypothetical protein ABFS12_03020 [Bacteroidota bacterium]
MQELNNILKKRRKYIAVVLILNFILYSTGQAFIIQECKCHFPEQDKIETTNCCSSKEVTFENDNHECCSANLINAKESNNSIEHSCTECSGSCSLSENRKIASPILFVSSIYSLEKTENVEFAYNVIFHNYRTSKINSRYITSYSYQIPISFGKDLIIELHSLKIFHSNS